MKKVSGIIPLAEHNSKAAWKILSSAAVPNVAKSESTCQNQNRRSSYILYQTSVLLSTPFSDCVHFCAHLLSFTSVPAWSGEHLPLVNILFQHRIVQKDCFQWFLLFGHPQIFCVNGLWKTLFHDLIDECYPISFLTRLFVCQKRALRTASLLLGKVCDLDGIRCSAVGHSRTHFHSVLHIF